MLVGGNSLLQVAAGKMQSDVAGVCYSLDSMMRVILAYIHMYTVLWRLTIVCVCRSSRARQEDCAMKHHSVHLFKVVWGAWRRVSCMSMHVDV